MTTRIWAHPFSLSELNEKVKDTLSSHLGICYIDMSDHHLTARMPVSEKVLQPMGIMHGGASATLAETVASVAANCCVDSEKKACVGVELNINHIKPMRSGYIDAIAKALHLGKTTQVWEIKIYDERKNLVSAARLTVAIIEKEKAPL